LNEIKKRTQDEAEYLKGARDMGGETLRVSGDIKIPNDECVESNLIVFGDLTTGRNVNFLGGLHVEGNTRLGEANFVRGSVHCEGNMMIGSQTNIEEAVYCLGILLIGKEVRVGLGEKGGGVVCESEIYVEPEFTSGSKLEAEKITTVERFDDELISRLNQPAPKLKDRRRETSPTYEVRRVQKETSDKKVLWQKTEHKGTAYGTPNKNDRD